MKMFFSCFFFIISALEFFVDILESICAIGVCYPFSFFPPLKSKEYRGERESRFCFHIKNPKAAHSMNFHQSGTSSPVFNDDRWNDLSSYFFSKERKNKSCEIESNWRDNHTERSGRNSVGDFIFLFKKKKPKKKLLYFIQEQFIYYTKKRCH
jgi:hypothetical protein